MKKFFKKSLRGKIYYLLICLLFLSIFQVTAFPMTSPEEIIREKLEAELAKESKIFLIVKRLTEGADCILQGKITNVSSVTLQNLTINGMAFKDRKVDGFRYSVVDVFEEQKVSIAMLNPQEMMEFEILIPGINWEGLNLHGVIFVQSEQGTTKEILQAVYIE